MTQMQLKVTEKVKGLGSQKGFYNVDYNGKTEKVQLFQFQETEDTPEYVSCYIDEKGKLQQPITVLSNKFYAEGEDYVFKIKYVRATLRYYDVEDMRLLSADNSYLRLLFNDSAADLKQGDVIRCTILRHQAKMILLNLVERNPSLIQYRTFAEFFSINDNDKNDASALAEVLTQTLALPHMAAVKAKYEACDGRWIYEFANNMENVLFELLSKDLHDKENIISQLCRAWLGEIEHSTFISEMNEREHDTYDAHLTRSIELCEDVLDAILNPTREEKVVQMIASLNPQFYQYRIEKRLRFIAVSFSLNARVAEKHMPQLLDMIKKMGQNSCEKPETRSTLSYILRLYVGWASASLDHMLSLNSAGTITIKRCALALCYLLRIMYATQHKDETLYMSRLYQLLALLNITEEEKAKLLDNAYKVYFATSFPVRRYNWDDFERIVKNELYRFVGDNLMLDTNKILAYDNARTQVYLTNNLVSVAPCRTEARELSSMQLANNRMVQLKYGRSLANICQEEDFQEVRGQWNDVTSEVLAEPKAVVKVKANIISDGDEVDIYVVEIVNETTIKCRTVDTGEEGLLSYSSLFYYPKPQLNYGDFLGVGGSPLVFPAIYHNNDGEITFDCQSIKHEFSRDVYECAVYTCLVISVINKSCQGITDQGFYVNFPSNGEDIQKGTFVDVYITGAKESGHWIGEYEGVAEQEFDNQKSYSNFFRYFCSWAYGETKTKATFEAENADQSIADSNGKMPTATISHEGIKSITSVLITEASLVKDPRVRYAHLAIADVLSQVIGDAAEHELNAHRMRYIHMLYRFSVNHELTSHHVEEYNRHVRPQLGMPEMRERANVIDILGRMRNRIQNGIDTTLTSYLTENATPLERELARLVLAHGLLADIKTKAMDNQLLDEIGKELGIDIAKHHTVHIGEESQTMEFKTSLVYPPNNRGNDDIEQQSDNIIRVITSMMASQGGTLYIGVNDDGDVIGIHNDISYFMYKRHCDENKARDWYLNHFACLLSERLGTGVAQTVHYSYEDYEGYTVLKIVIPVNHTFKSDYTRVGNTSQRNK